MTLMILYLLRLKLLKMFPALHKYDQRLRLNINLPKPFFLKRLFFAPLICLLFIEQANAQNDLPGPAANIEPIKAGSLVIGMDNTTQAVPGYFNLKAYGLVNLLLQNNIPVKWAIKAGKPKDGSDFTATVQREFPSSQSATTYSFRSGPFIIDSAYAQAARTIITNWGKNVAVYRLTTNITADIRYTLYFKPRIAVFDHGGNSKIHLNYLLQAGVDTHLYVKVIPEPQPLNPCQNGGYTFVSEAHWDDHTDTAVSHSVYRYIKSGGNFLAACAAIELYENDDTLHTTTGLDKTNAGYNTFEYANPDLPFLQIDGPLGAIGGALHNWNKKATSSWRSYYYPVVKAPGGLPYQTAAAAKCIAPNLSGGNVFYLGGHDYGNNNNADDINGRRMYLNAMLQPPGGAAYMCNMQPFVPNLVPTPVKCFGNNDGSITASATGGVGPYKFQWASGDTSRVLTNLAPGTYSVTITDYIGQTTVSTATVTQSPALSATSNVSSYNGYNIKCFGSVNGFVNLTINGGTGPYTYNWSNGSTSQNLVEIGAGTYTYTVVDSRGCSVTNSVVLNGPSKLNAPYSATNYNGRGVSCYGATNGSITLNTSGGTTPYTYSWQPGGITTQNLSNVGAGSYTYVVTDANGCSSSSTVVLTAPPALASPVALSNYNGRNISCNGTTDGSIDLTVSGGTAPYAYSWSNGATTQDLNNIGVGSYSYTITDANGCTNSGAITMTGPGPLTSPSSVSNYNGSGVSCYGRTDGYIHLTVSGGTTPYIYNWSNGSNSQNLDNIGAGTYSYTITDVNGCSTSNTITLGTANTLATPVTHSDFNGSGISCNGTTNGWINMTVTGGTGPYSYHWAPNGATTQNLNNIGAGDYTYTVTDANGCSTSDMITITAPPALSAPSALSDFHGANLSCESAADGYINLSVSGGTAPYSYEWTPGNITTQNLTNVGAGTYSYKVTDANGCIVTNTVTLLAPDPLTTTYVVSDFNGYNVSCNNSTNGYINLTVNGGTPPYSYLWTPGGDITQNLQGIGAGTYSYSVTDANGCVSSASVTLTSAITLTTPETVSDYHGSNVSCVGSTNGYINLSVIGGTAPYSYSWLPGGETSKDLTNIGAGQYSYVVTDANGCTSSNSLTLIGPDPLNPVQAVSDFNGLGVSCNGYTNGFINLTVTGGKTPYLFNWNTGSTSQNLSQIGAGTYTYTVTDANGCSSSNTVVISQPDPVAAPSTASNYNGFGIKCYGTTTGEIHLHVSGGTTPYSYVWAPGGNTTPDLVNVGAGTYSYIVTDANGCAVSNSVTLTTPIQLNTLSSSSNYNGMGVSCYGFTDGFINLNVTGGALPYSFVWAPNSSTSQNLSNLGAGTYSYLVTDANGCVASNSITLAAPVALTSPKVTSAYNGYGISCHGQSNGFIDYTIHGGTQPYSYHWYPGNAITQDLHNLTAGTYKYIITDANGCSVIDSTTLNEPALLTVASGNITDALCNGSTDGALAVTMNGGVMPYNYSWSNGMTGQFIGGLHAGNYSVVITDANNCTVMESMSVSQPSPLNVAMTTAYHNGNFNVSCNGVNDGIAGATINGGTAPYTYLWSNGSTNSSATYLHAGNYSVTITDSHNCITSGSITITQPPAINVSAGSNSQICGSTFELDANSPLAGFTGTWSAVNGNAVFNNQHDAHTGITFYGYGSHQMVWSLTDGVCMATDTVNIDVFEPVSANISSMNDSICPKKVKDLMLIADALTAGNGVWMTDNFASISSPYSNITGVNQLSEGNNTFRWVVTNGPCSSSDSVSVYLRSKSDCYDDLEIPTGITPNGDGANDDFDIHAIEKYPYNTFEVFNRWGNLVYSADNYVNHQWTGLNNKGEELPDGTYFVILSIKNSEINLHGYVDIRR